jgi:hypothetical protein
MSEPTKILHPTPKMVFMSSGNNVSAHRKMLESPEFQRAIDYAKSHYTRALHASAPNNLDSPNFASAAAMSFERIQGMEDFISILMTLSETPPPLPERARGGDNLEQPPQPRRN